MEYDYLIRVILICMFSVVIPIAAYYRIKAHSQGEKLHYKEEGIVLFTSIRFFAFLSAVGFVLYLYDPSIMAWASLELPMFVRFLGLSIGFLGGAMWIATFHYLDLNLTDTVMTRTNATLVTKGPYAYMRHPLYTAMLFISVANGLATLNWFILCTGLIVFLLLARRTIIEETMLVKKFGSAYESYQRSTRQFFPEL